MNCLSIVAIVKNEARYIEEWIAFHKMHGVEHFYLYDNGSTDDTVRIIESTDNATLIRWDQSPGQLSAYSHAIKHFKDETEWAAFIDVDEFLYCTKRPLPHWLELHQDRLINAFAAHWYLYGSNGELQYRNELVTKRFTKRQVDVNPHVKSIVRLEYALKPIDPHSFEVVGFVANEQGNFLPKHYSLEENGTADILRINHYHTKSLGEAIGRWKLPRADNGQRRDENFEEHFTAHDRNEVFDDSAVNFCYSDRLEEILNER